MDGRTDGRTDGRKDGRMDGRTNGRTDGQTDGWMNEKKIYEKISYAVNKLFFSKNNSILNLITFCQEIYFTLGPRKCCFHR